MIYCGKKWGVFVKSGGVLTCCHFKNKNDNFLESNLSWFLLTDSSMTLSKTISSINCCSIDIMVRFMSCSVSDNIIRPNRTQKKNLTRHVTIRLEKRTRPKRRKIEQHIPSKELLVGKITGIYITTKMASPTHNNAVTLKERNHCSFTGFTLSKMTKLLNST